MFKFEELYYKKINNCLDHKIIERNGKFVSYMYVALESGMFLYPSDVVVRLLHKKLSEKQLMITMISA